MKLHQKGYLLVELCRTGGLWDNEIVAKTLHEYGQEGDYWDKAVRVALEELAAGGLIARIETVLVHGVGKPALSFRYVLTDFGRQRMIHTGLSTEVAE